MCIGLKYPETMIALGLCMRSEFNAYAFAKYITNFSKVLRVFFTGEEFHHKALGDELVEFINHFIFAFGNGVLTVRVP